VSTFIRQNQKIKNLTAIFTSAKCVYLCVCVYVCVFQGAFWGLMTGLVVGLSRMVLEFSYEIPSCGQPDGRPALLADVHYLYFALILLALTSLIIAAVSLATAPIPKEHVRTTSYIDGHPYPALLCTLCDLLSWRRRPRSCLSAAY